MFVHRRAAAGLVALLAAAGAGCSERAAPNGRDAVTVVVAGDGDAWSPFPWSPGADDGRPLETRFSLELGYGGAPIPGQRLSVVTDVSVRVEGPRRAVVAIEAVDLRADDPDPDRAAAVRGDFAAQSPVGLEAVLDPERASGDALAFPVPPGAGGAVRQYLDALSLAFDLLLVPWPGEGEARPGTRWTRTRDVEIARLRLTERATYTLEETSAAEARLAVEGIFTGRGEEIEFVGLPPGSGCRVRSLEARVSGTLTVTRGAPLATRASLDFDLRLLADVTADGETAPLDGRLTLHVSRPPTR